VQRFVAKPQRINEQVVDAIERASFALLDYVGRLLAGRSVSALSMFPQYRAVQELAGAERWALRLAVPSILGGGIGAALFGGSAGAERWLWCALRGRCRSAQLLRLRREKSQ